MLFAYATAGAARSSRARVDHVDAAVVDANGVVTNGAYVDTNLTRRVFAAGFGSGSQAHVKSPNCEADANFVSFDKL